MVRCPKCDMETPLKSLFCPYCGSRLVPQISPIMAVLVVSAAFFSMILSASLLMATGLPLAMHIASAIGESMFLLIPLIYMIYKKVGVRKYMMFGSAKHLVYGPILGICLWIVSITLVLVLTYLLGPSKAVGEAEEFIVGLVEESPPATILLMFVTGASEEFAFRCFLQNALKRRYSLPVAIIGASIAFGLAHFDPQAVYIIGTFVVGLLLGILYDRFRSYTMAATAHATFNIVSIALLLLA